MGMSEGFTAQDALRYVTERASLTQSQMQSLMRQIMMGEISPVMVAAILAGLRTKGESVDEISAAAQVMREFATPVHVANKTKLIDIVGTGGDGASTFNISTCTMFVVAAAGAKVSKHGNRSVSSKSGSADVLESLGLNLMCVNEKIAQSIESVGVGFMFAPNHHPAMKNVAPIRKEMGVKTVFNILGPLTNPAGAPQIVMGVFHPDLVGTLAQVLRNLGAHRAMVVYGKDGIDEVSLGAETMVAELSENGVQEYTIRPEEYGFKRSPLELLQVHDAEQSKAVVLSVLNGQLGPAMDIVLLNAGVALYTANVTETIQAGITLAREVILSGAARKKLDDFVAFSHQSSWQ
jgi:anthranilate phosphoribosyltransferase